MENITRSREKDYNNPFRKMVYDSQEEMDKVMGSLSDNSFIRQEAKALKTFEKNVATLISSFNTAKKAKRKGS